MALKQSKTCLPLTQGTALHPLVETQGLSRSDHCKINERVRFARRRFGRDVVIDFLAVLFGYAISGERTLEACYERLQPFAVPFLALFERDP